jgi:hypothetical protein
MEVFLYILMFVSMIGIFFGLLEDLSELGIMSFFTGLISLITLVAMPGEHNHNFKSSEKLIAVRDCIAAENKGIVKKGTIGMYQKMSNRDNIIQFVIPGHKFEIDESCVKRVNENPTETALGSSLVRLGPSPEQDVDPKVTFRKLQIICTKDGKKTTELVDSINFATDKVYNCTVRTAQIKYEPIVTLEE